MPRLLWQPGLDIWNAVISAALSTAVVVSAATGNATVSPVASTPTISQPAAGSGLSSAAPGAIVGQAPPGSVVQVYDGDKKLGETTADRVGNYRFSLPTLAPGQHTLSTRTNDANGNPIARSAPVPVTVSGGPVAQVMPTQAGTKPGAQAPTFTDLPQGTQWPSGMPAMLAGTAPPGSKVQVFDNDRLVTETIAPQDGKWSLALPALTAGDHFLTTRAYGPDGTLLGESAPAKVTVVGPGTPTVAVRPAATAGVQMTRTAVVTSAAGTTPKATVTASLATTATRITTATLAATAPLTGPAATAQAARPAFTGLTEGAPLPPGAPLTGTAAPGARLRLFDGDKPLGETTAGPDGKWSLALPALSAGTHALTASALGPDGRVLATSTPLNVTVAGTPGTAAPARPAFTGLTEGAPLPPGAPLTGTAAPGTRIRLFDGDKPLGETTAGPDGKWSLALPALAAGDHSLTARAVGPDGSILASSAPLSVAVGGTPGTAAQARPAFTGLTEGAPLSPGAPLTGTAALGARLRLFDGDKPLGETTAGPDGKWSLTLPALTAGAHSLTARAVGPDGSILASSAPLSVAVGGTPGTAAPARPAFTGLTEGAPLPPGAPLTGTAAPGARLRLFDGDRPLGETTAGPDGKWSLTLPALTEGAHSLTARAVGPDGSILASSTPLNVTVGGTPGTAGAAARPAFTGLTEGAPLSPGAPLTGTAAPGAKLRLFDGDKPLAEITAGPDGKWSLALPALAAGTHALTASALGPDGRILASSTPLNVTVGGTPGTAGAAARPAFTGLTEGAPLSPGAPLTGTAAPGARLRLFDGDKPLAETTAGPDGKWSLALPALSAGTHALTASALGPDGRVLATSTPLNVTVAGTPGTAAPARPTFTGLTEGAPLSPGAPLTGTAAPATRIRLFDGDRPLAETTAGPDGRWSLTLPALTAGAHSLTARAVGPDGSILASSAPLSVAVGGTPGTAAQAAARPAFTGLTEGAPLSPGAPLTGTAAPGARLRLFDGDRPLGETTAGPDGKWSLALPALTAGTHALTASALGPDGRILATSTPLNVTVAGTPGTAAQAAARPAFTGLTEGAPLSPGAPLTGTAAPATRIRLFDGDRPLAETTAGPDGKWSLALPALTAGDHSLTARAVGPDGSILASSAPLSVTVAGTPGTAAPARPAFTGLTEGAPLSPGAPLTGTAAPGARLRLFDGDKPLAETTAGPDGKWSLALPALTEAEGTHALTASALGPDGRVLATSTPLSVTVAGAPGTAGAAARPAFTGLTEGAPLPPGAPLTGTAAPGARLRLFDGDKPLAETTAGPDGKWSLALPALTAGTHALTASALGPDGRVLASSTPLSVTVGGTPGTAGAAARPAFTGLTEGAPLPPGAPLTGTAAPGARIRLFDGDKPLAETTAGPDGKWSLALPALTEGAHSLTARAVSPDGRILASSTPLSVTVAGTPGTAGAAARPAFTGLTEGAHLPPGAPLTGTAAPGAKLRLFDGDRPLGETTAGPDGKWSLTLPALTEGAHSLTARAVGPDGSILASSTPLNVTVGGTPGTAAPAAGTPGGGAVITETVRPTGVMTGTPQVAQPAGVITGTPGPTRPGGTTTPGGVGVSLPAGAPIFLMGMADPGAKLRIFSDNTQVGETVSDALGQWRLMLPALQSGTHELVARIFDAAGKLVTSSAPLTVMIIDGSALGATPGAATPTPGGGTPAAAGTPSAQVTTATPPEIIGPLAGSEVPATSPGALEGKAEPGSTIRIYDGDKLVAEIVVGPDGTWRVMLPQMADGPHAFVVRVVSPDGSEAAPSAPVLVVVRPALVTTPIPAASGAAPSAGRPSVSSPAGGGAIQSSQPLLSGSAAPGSTVRIYDGNVLIDETKADSAGRWHFVPPIPLAIGKHALRVASVGPDGMEAPAEVLELVVAEGATGLKPLRFSASYGKAPSPFGLLQGTAPPGAIVVLYDGDVRVVKIPVDANGQWQYALPARTRLGLHQFSIVVTSSDGAIIYRSQPIGARIGAGPPPFPPRTGPHN